MQLGGTEQGIIERSSIKLGFYRSVCMCEVRPCCDNVCICVFMHAQ